MAHLLYRYRIHLLAMFTACVLLIGLAMYLVCNLGGWPRGRYPQFTYTWEPGNQVLFTHRGFDSSYDSKLGIVSLYLKLSDGTVLHLPDITLEIAEKISNDAGFRKLTWSGSPNMLAFTDDCTTLDFDDGILQSVLLDSDSKPPFGIALAKEGPFVPMPETKKELVAIFGKPVDWKRYHPPTSP